MGTGRKDLSTRPSGSTTPSQRVAGVCVCVCSECACAQGSIDPSEVCAYERALGQVCTFYRAHRCIAAIYAMLVIQIEVTTSHSAVCLDRLAYKIARKLCDNGPPWSRRSPLNTHTQTHATCVYMTCAPVEGIYSFEFY